MKVTITLEELKMWAEAYPNMPVRTLIEILSNRTSEYKVKRGCYYGK